MQKSRMLSEIREALNKADIWRWNRITVEFGQEELEIIVPSHLETLEMKENSPLTDPQNTVEEALNNPIATHPLNEIIKRRGKPPHQLSVSVVVSDITRPVPYRGERGILLPLLQALERDGIRRENILIIVATGMHRASTWEEKLQMFGDEVVGRYSIKDHDCEDQTGLVYAGSTSRGTQVFVNKNFYQSDLRIITGLVESHFMAGFSGGRKAICPGLVDKRTICHFHGPELLEHPLSTNLILEGNPCHEEALEVAQKVGVSFTVNVTLNRHLKLTGIFTGDLVQAHLAACRKVKEEVAISIDHTYDIVLTHAGYVGINHYQTAKAAVGALPAIKERGTIIIAANNFDSEPIGGPEYKSLLHILKLQGPQGYIDYIHSPGYEFTKDQWEPQMWEKVLRKVSEEGLIYCSPNIPPKDYEIIPGVSGYIYLEAEEMKKPLLEKAQLMVQRALIHAVYRIQKIGKKPTLAFIKGGPYAVPLL
jgi:nickel-dependent lactate racemase